MSWLYTIVFAGLMFSTDSNLPISNSNNFTDLKTINVIRADETERFEQTYPLNANGRVSVSNVNGSITIQTWERNEVKLEYVKTADTKEYLADVTVRIDARQDSIRVETEYGEARTIKSLSSAERRSYGKLQVEYRLMVPRTAVLNEIDTVNGSINISNASTMTKASAVNGEVRATNLRGAANLSTVNGTVIADFDQLQTGSRISLNTVNGTVDLVIPSDANATVKADTVNGSISNDFGLPVRKGEYVGRDLYGKIGTGDVQIRLNSVNGGLSIKRKNDGKSVNPATNLLNMKNNDDDDDWNDDRDRSRVRVPKPPKPPKAPVIVIDNEAIRKSVEESMKDASKELIEANKELAKLAPELEKKYAETLKQATIINSEEMQAKIAAAQKKYSETMARMSESYWTIGSPAIEKKTETFTVKGTPKVKVEAKNCAVFVRGWDKSEVQYTVTRFSKSRSQTPLDLKATQNGSDVDIKLLNGDNASPQAGYFRELNRVRIEIFVPKKSDLKITTGGEIRLEGVSGEIDLQGSEEAINVRDSDGKLNVASTEGIIRVIGFRGAFDGKTGDGTMNLEGDFQSFNALAADGTIVLTLPENANAVFESNAEIESEGVNLIRDDAKTKLWRVGKGGKTYRMNVAEGNVIVRSASSIAVY